MPHNGSRLGQQILAGFVVAVFSCAGAVIFWFLATTCWQHFQAQHWPGVPAQGLEWDLQSSRTQRSTATTRLVVRYHYQYQGQTYQGHRLDLSMGSDNFSGARRRRIMENLRAPTQTVYVNPAAPAESLLERTLPTPQLAFALVFLLFPCGLGTLFGASFCLQGLQRLTGQDTARWTFPVLGMLHGGFAPYILGFGAPDRGPGSTLILVLFTGLAGYSLYEFGRRLWQPERGHAPAWQAFQRRASHPRPNPVRRLK
jgi:hypothetical protein